MTKQILTEKNVKRSSLKRQLLANLPTNRLLYRLCKYYVDLCNGENNDDMATNGELRFIQRALPQCATVFDVGANAGDWTALALTVNPRLAVHCYEPSETTYQRLLARRFPPSVICNNYGLSSTAGMRTLYVFGDGSGANSLYRRQSLEGGGDWLPDRAKKLFIWKP